MKEWLRTFKNDVDREYFEQFDDYHKIPWDVACWWNTGFANMSSEWAKIKNGDIYPYDVIGDEFRGALAGTNKEQWYNAIAERIPADESTFVLYLSGVVGRVIKANADSLGKVFMVYDAIQGIWIEENTTMMSNGNTVTAEVSGVITAFVEHIRKARMILLEMANIAFPDAGPKPPAQAGQGAIAAWMTADAARKEALKPITKIERFCDAVMDGKYRNILSKWRAEVAIPVTSWDSKMEWIIVEEGAVHLPSITATQTAYAVPYIPETMSTLKIDASIAEHIKDDGPSEWFDGVKKVLPNEKVRTYLQKRYGAAVLGRPGQVGKSLVWQYGMGDTAKSSIQECIAGQNGVFSPYAITTESSILTRAGEKTGAAERFKAYARGKRFALINELDDGDRVSQSILKSLTGGDTVTGTAKYANAVEYSFTATLFVSSNHPPTLPPGDLAAAKRIHVVPFTHKLWLRSKNPEEWAAAPPEHRADEDWVEKIVSSPKERSAVLLWILDGIFLFRKEGLGELPVEMVEANEEFTAEADPVTTIVKSLLGEEGYEDRPWIKIYDEAEWLLTGFNNKDALTVQEFKTLFTIRANELKFVKIGEEPSQSMLRAGGHLLHEMGGERKKIFVNGKSFWAFTLVRLQPSAVGWAQ